MCRGYILYNSAQCTLIKKQNKKTSVKLHSQMTPHVSPLRASYGVPFMTYTQNNDRDISEVQCITKNRTV